MRGRTLILGFAAFVALFAAALIYSQEFAYYERQEGDMGAVRIAGEVVAVVGYKGIDAASSPLKLRSFRIDPAAVHRLEPAADATPLGAPFWFRCFSAGTLTRDLAAGGAAAYRIARDTPSGFDLMDHRRAHPRGRVAAGPARRCSSGPTPRSSSGS